MTVWYCVDCNKTICYRCKALSKVQKQECEICYEHKLKKYFKTCTQCVHLWCAECNRKISQCPFCRHPQKRPQVFRARRVSRSVIRVSRVDTVDRHSTGILTRVVKALTTIFKWSSTTD